MPTENRSSNTDPRDVFIRLNPLGLGEAELRKDSTGFEDQRTHSDYLLFLAGYRETHPEPQPHPEPIAWTVGTAFWWTKEEAERDAAATGLPIVGLGPMTDRGEVDLLSQVIRNLNDERDELGAAVGRLRAQLAERDALLRELADAPPAAMEFRLQQKVKAALSASAEPSALPDPLGCKQCAHPDCGKFDGPRQVECRAMADNACARPGASS